MPTLINNLTSTAVMTCVIGKCKNHDFFNLQSCNKTYNPPKDVCSLLIMFLSPVTRAPTPRPCPVAPPAPSWWGTPSLPSPGTRQWPALSTRLVTPHNIRSPHVFLLLAKLCRGRTKRVLTPPAFLTLPSFTDWLPQHGREGEEGDQQHQHGIRGGGPVLPC